MTSPDRNTLLAKTPHERVAYVETIRIWYPRMRALYDAMTHLHELNPVSAEPQCLMLVGSTGVGKSTVLRSYVADHPRDAHPAVDHLPVLQVTVPARATIRNFATKLLFAIGDPLADKGTVGSMEARLLRFLRACAVEALVVDDLQHFVDRESERVLHDVSNWLKNLVKETHIACIMAGLPEAEQVLHANPQLGRLFGDPYELHPFRWEASHPKTIAEFRTFLQLLEGLLPLPHTLPLASTECAWRCFVASEGNMAHLMNLIRRATQSAIVLERPALDFTLLADAFDHRLAGKRRGIPNPFVGELPQFPTTAPHV